MKDILALELVRRPDLQMLRFGDAGFEQNVSVSGGSHTGCGWQHHGVCYFCHCELLLPLLQPLQCRATGCCVRLTWAQVNLPQV